MNLSLDQKTLAYLHERALKWNLPLNQAVVGVVAMAAWAQHELEEHVEPLLDCAEMLERKGAVEEARTLRRAAKNLKDAIKSRLWDAVHEDGPRQEKPRDGRRKAG